MTGNYLMKFFKVEKRAFISPLLLSIIEENSSF